jgi:uncharacterized membrane protein YqaE (UPF0057 family)
MRLILAIVLPPLCFLLIGRPVAALVALLLCISLAGWLFAALWAIYALGQHKTDRKIASALDRRAFSD